MSSEVPIIGDKVDEVIISQTIKELPRFTQAIPIVFPDKFPELFKEKMCDKTRKVVPILISSHTSHLDGLPLVALTTKLLTMSDSLLGQGILKGFKIPIASSMKTGDQGSVVREGTIRMQNIMSQQFNLEAIPYTRDKDKAKYGLKGNNLGSMLRLVRGAKNGYGIADFPEATMQGGRIKKNILFGEPERFGLQEFNDIEEISEIARMAGKEPLYIPVGIDGGFRLESPDNNRLTLAYLTEIFLTHPSPTTLVSVRVGTPIFQEEIGSKNINTFLGEKVAQLLPEQARGVYA